jgi:hypothetical protein
MTCKFVVNGVDYYTIEIRPYGTYYTLHALRYPANSRGGCVTDHHLYATGEICVSAGNAPRTIDRAKAIAMSWCEGWSKYIRGYEFPNGAKRVAVNS